jgi:leader peptidase (prepilin peptidase)/N-methyltransferase
VTLPPLVVLAVFGLMIGSFLNVCIARLPAGESVVSPRSRCPTCQHAIAWYDNVPLLSYALLGARCRGCRTPISVRYPIVEAATATLFVVQGVWFMDEPLVLVQRVVLTAMLVVLFGTDLDVQRLPNVITLPGIAVGLAFSPFVPPGLVDGLMGAALGAAILGFVRWGWKALTGVDGMGLGDVKMLAMVGAFLGWRQVLVVLFLASLTGAVAGITLIALGRRSLQTRLPFGTFLAVATYVASLVGERLLQWYAGLYGP